MSAWKRQARADKPTVPPPVTNNIPKTAEDLNLRSQSAFPSLAASVEKISISDNGSEKSTARSFSLRPSVRPVLRSAVPETHNLNPIVRPDNFGQVGQPIQIYTNHFKLNVDSEAKVNHYDIDIGMIGRDKKLRLARKDERWETLQRLAKRENFPVIWYDEGKNIYTKANLAHFTKPLQITFKMNNEDKTFQLTINNLVRQEKMRDIFDFIQKKITTRPHDPMRIIETLFKQRSRNDMVCVKNQFYDKSQRLDDLGDGRGMANGFYQALCLTQCGPTLNINLTFTCFYMPLNFVEFASKYLRKDIRDGMKDYEIDGLKKIVKNLLVETNHTGRDIRYRIRGFGLSPAKIKFTRNTGENTNGDQVEVGEEVSVADFFAEKYHRLKYPNLPCIDGMSGGNKKANWLPMEMCKVVEWERCLKPLDSVQRALVTKKSVIKPVDRYARIMQIVDKRSFATDPYLKELDIKVETGEMLKVNARILPPPEVKYRQDAVERVQFGKWTIRKQFFTTKDIKTWAICYFAPDRPNEGVIGVLKEFQVRLPQLLGRYGIRLLSNPVQKSNPANPQGIKEVLIEAQRNRWELTIVVLNNTKEEVYDYVKQLGNQRLGVITQCVSFQALERNCGKLDMYVQNLSQKINAKLGCINGVVNLKSALSRPQNDDLFMFMGADLTHTTSSTDRPSIAAVVGSRDATGSLYAARLCEQFPKAGRCSVEIIKELDTIATELLHVFQQQSGGRLPTKIVFYRDGVDDGAFQKVLDNEVKQLKAACKTVFGAKAQPKICFIVVKKRHNTRFFVYDGRETKNVEAGTVIDSMITHPSQFDFYLNSHAAIMGTSRPALYHVLHDEIGFTSDEIQQLTYYLCHTDARCSKAVSIPAPVHYAHLAAKQSRSFDYEDNRDPSEEFVENTEEISMEDIRTKLMVLDPKIQNDMWFV